MTKPLILTQVTTNDYRDVSVSIPWSLSSQSDMLRKMSALCYLFARNIQDLMIKEGVTPPPIGKVYLTLLINSLKNI